MPLVLLSFHKIHQLKVGLVGPIIVYFNVSHTHLYSNP